MNIITGLSVDTVHRIPM